MSALRLAVAGCLTGVAVLAAPDPSRVTFNKDVLPILQKNCQSCHRPGEVGPFSLMTYKQAVNWASDIKDYTHNRRMPPWKPIDGKEFIGERKLSDKEIATLAAWVDAGTPAGSPAAAPAPRRFPEGWQESAPASQGIARFGSPSFAVFWQLLRALSRRESIARSTPTTASAISSNTSSKSSQSG